MFNAWRPLLPLPYVIADAGPGPLLPDRGRLVGGRCSACAAGDSAWTAAELAVLLIDQGRVAEALALFATQEAPVSEDDHAFWRQFHREGRAAKVEPPRTVGR